MVQWGKGYISAFQEIFASAGKTYRIKHVGGGLKEKLSERLSARKCMAAYWEGGNACGKSCPIFSFVYYYKQLFYGYKLL